MNQSRGKIGYIGLKIDLSEAFDKLEWKFIDLILVNLGFHSTFIRWIMQCISISSFSILINGSPCGFFKAFRGLRQGDPLSPYLFILSMEILSRMSHLVENQNLIKGIKISKNNLKINHLLYVDDLLILLRACTPEVKNGKFLLDILCA